MNLQAISDGLIAALASVTGVVTRRALSTGDLDDQDGTLIIVPNALLVMFNGGDLTSRDVGAFTYNDDSLWLIWVVAEDLGGSEAAATTAYTMIDEVKNALAGHKITSGADSVQVVLEGIDAQEVTHGRAIFGVNVRARGMFQKS